MDGWNDADYYVLHRHWFVGVRLSRVDRSFDNTDSCLHTLLEDVVLNMSSEASDPERFFLHHIQLVSLFFDLQLKDAVRTLLRTLQLRRVLELPVNICAFDRLALLLPLLRFSLAAGHLVPHLEPLVQLILPAETQPNPSR
jgi:hypothetical protein